MISPGSGLDPLEFHKWWQEALEMKVPPAEIIEKIGGASELDVCRQLVVAYVASAPIVQRLIEACRFAKNPRIRVYAEALDCYRLVAQHSRRDDSPSAPAVGLLPKLEKHLHDSETVEQTWFEKEIQAVLHMAISNAYLLKGDPQGALEHVSESYYLSLALKSRVFQERARTMQLSCLAAEGHLSSALAMISEGDARFQPVSSEAHNLKVQAYTLSQLGNLEESLACFDQVASLRTSRKERLEIDRARIELIWGIGGFDKETDLAMSKSTIEVTLFRGLAALVRAYRLPRDKAHVEKRKRLLHDVVVAWHGIRHSHTGNWANFLGRWAQAKAHYLLGETTLAQNGFQDLKSATPELLDWRLLQAGMALDIALHVNQPGLEVSRWVEVLREVFRDARSIPYASNEGLAQRLMFWHPIAATFMAVIQDPLGELKPATQTILRLGTKSTWWGAKTELPPTLAAELVLRSMDVDLNPRVRFQQATLGKHREKRFDIEEHARKNNTPSGFVSAGPLVFGLVKLGEYDRARSVYQEFGMVPDSRAEYVGLEMVEQIDVYTRMLLDKTMNPSVYSRAINDLGSGVSYAT